MGNKKGYYCIDDINECDAQYNIIIGERSNGKSYAVKYHCIEDFINKGEKFVLLRRFTIEIKGGFWANSYFEDVDIKKLNIPKEYKEKYDCINVWSGGIYLAHYYEEDGLTKIKRDVECGRVIALGGASHVKSMVGNSFGNIIFEEFITDGMYIVNEPHQLQQFVSTIARRRAISVYMIGNTISRLCPYFNEWSLEHIPQQKQGTIDIYTFDTGEIDKETNEPIHIKIAVEVTAHADHNTSKMFFGTKSKAIVNGSWEAAEQPHLPEPYERYTPIYGVMFIESNMKYYAEVLDYDRDNEHYQLVFVRPASSKSKAQRIVQKEYSTELLVTDKLYPLTQGDKIMRELIKLNKIVYSDNLTGSEFKVILPKLI